MNSGSDRDGERRSVPTPAAFGEPRWRRLLDEIKDGQVVPVIGPELLIVESDPPRTLMQALGAALVDSFELDPSHLPELPTVTDVAVEYARQRRDPVDLYYEVSRVMREGRWSIPPALRQLAEIRPFSLFVSTSFDDLMKRALDEVRYGGNDRTCTFAFSALRQSVDLPAATQDVPAVYQLFGALSTSPEYAVGEEDLLRFTHQLQLLDRRPERLFEQLRTKSLLVLGCSFPDWLLRFLLVSAKGDQLFGDQGSRGVVADRRTRADAGLVSFLERRRAVIYPHGDGNDFVSELSRRWQALAKDTRPPPPPPAVPGLPELPPNSVFISYASEDRAAATRLRDALDKFGVAAWMDTQQLQMGDAYEQVINRNIDSSVLFLPLLSRHTTTPDPRFFRVEWRAALKQAERRSTAFPFILPIAIDDVSPDDPSLPAEFNSRHWARCAGGTPSEATLEGIRDRLRAWHRARGTPVT